MWSQIKSYRPKKKKNMIHTERIHNTINTEILQFQHSLLYTVQFQFAIICFFFLLLFVWIVVVVVVIVTLSYHLQNSLIFCRYESTHERKKWNINKLFAAHAYQFDFSVYYSTSIFVYNWLKLLKLFSFLLYLR